MRAISHKRTKRRRRFIAIVVAFARLLLLSAIGLGAWHLVPRTARQTRKPAVIAEPGVTPQIRDVYPLSLIPGGVHADADLEDARAGDPVLADHYADVGFLRPTFLSHDQLFYASYREGQSIVWTGSPIRVRAGEAVLSDRNGNLIRGRCGNRLSQTRRSPVAFTEPPQSTFDEPKITFPDDTPLPDISLDGPLADALPEFAFVAPPPSGPLTLQVPTTAGLSDDWASAIPPEVLVPGFVTPARPGPKPGVPIPEPSSSLLLAPAVIAAAWLCRKSCAQKR